MCFLVKAHFLLAFFSLCGWWIFPILVREGLEGRNQNGEPSHLPPAVGAECLGGRGACRSPSCLSPCHTESQPRRSGGRASVPPSPREIVNGMEEGGRSRPRRTLEPCRLESPIFHGHFCQQAGPSWGVCVLETWSPGSERGQQAWWPLVHRACHPSVPASGCGGDHLPTWSLRSCGSSPLQVGRTRRRQEPPLVCRQASPEQPVTASV